MLLTHPLPSRPALRAERIPRASRRSVVRSIERLLEKVEAALAAAAFAEESEAETARQIFACTGNRQAPRAPSRR